MPAKKVLYIAVTAGGTPNLIRYTTMIAENETEIIAMNNCQYGKDL